MNEIVTTKQEVYSLLEKIQQMREAREEVFRNYYGQKV